MNGLSSAFTVGRDREMDLYLAKYDVLGSMAHITMLESIGMLEKDELTQSEAKTGSFKPKNRPTPDINKADSFKNTLAGFMDDYNSGKI